MARIFIDGFEHGGFDLWTTQSGAATAAASTHGMDGSYCLDLVSQADFVTKTITADDEMYFAFLWKPSSFVGSNNILGLLKGTTVIGGVSCTAAGILKAQVGTAAAVATTTMLITLNSTYLIEIRYKMADAPNGVIQVKLNGILVIDFTGDTKPGADTTFDTVKLGAITYDASVNAYSYYDNFIMDDAAWIGNTKIQGILPTGAGATTGWTPSTGSNYACVDEVPVSDTDYISVNSNDAVDTYAAANMNPSPNSIKTVAVQARISLSGTPTPQNIAAVVRPVSTDRVHATSVTVPSGWAMKQWLWELNPEDSAAWAEADVNGMELGIKSLA